MIDVLVENNSGADPGAQRGVEHVAKSHARAPDRFRQRRGIRIIIDLCADVKDPLHFRGQRKISPARNVRRIQHHSGARIERPRRANPYSCKPGTSVGPRRKHRLNGILDRREARRRIFTRAHRHTRLQQNRALRIHQADGNFRPANIHAQR